MNAGKTLAGRIGGAALALVLAAVLAACERGSGVADPRQRLAEAETAFRAGELRRAVVLLKSVLADSPGEVRARWLLGLAHLRMGAPAAAEKELRRALELGMAYESLVLPLAQSLLAQRRLGALVALEAEGLPPRVAADLAGIKALGELAQGRLEEADRRIQEALALSPQARWLRLARARLDQARGKDDAALETLRALAFGEIRDEAAELAAVMLGVTERVRGRLDAALAALERALELNAANHGARVQRVLVLLRLGRLEDADRDLKILARAAPRDPQALYARGMRALMGGRPQEGLELLQTASEAAPQSVPVLVALGLAHAALGNREQAMQALGRALGMRPWLLDVRLILARLLLRWNEPQEALKVVDAAPPRQREDPAWHAVRGMALLRLGRREEALASLERAASVPAPVIRLESALALAGAGRLEQALRLARETLSPAEGSDDAAAGALLEAVLALRAGDAGRAERAARRLVEARPGKGAYWLLLARALVRGGRIEEAGRAYRRALEAEPKLVQAKLGLADLHLREGRKEDARRLLREAHEDEPRRADAALRLAMLASQDGDMDAALRWARAAVEREPESPRARLVLGGLLLEQGEWADAASEARAVLERDPGDARALLLLAKALTRLGDGEGAEAALARLAELAPRAWRPRLLLGGVRERLGRPEAAERAYREALSLPGGEVPARLALARLAARRGEAKAAARWLEGVPAEVLETPPGLEARAAVAAAEGRWGACAELLGRLRASRPDDFELAVRHARALSRAGQREGSVSVWEGWLRRHPRDVRAMKMLASAYARAGRRGKALALLEQVVQLAPRDVAALNDLAYGLRERDPRRAWTLVERALAEAPDLPEVRDTAARVLLALGRASEAVQQARQAVAGRPDDPRLRLTLAEALAAAGEREAARREARALVRVKDGRAPPAAARVREAAQALLDRLGKGAS